MNNLEISQKAIKRAERWYQSSIRGFEDRRWDDVVYAYAMSLEQALKAIMILYGIEYPKKHDISKEYKNLKNQDIPEWFLEKLNIHADTLKNLIIKRAAAAYGYVDGITEEEFTEDANYFKEPVKEIIEDCKKLIDEYSKKPKSDVDEKDEE